MQPGKTEGCAVFLHQPVTRLTCLGHNGPQMLGRPEGNRVLLLRAQVPPGGASGPGTTETPIALTGSNATHQGLEEQAPTVPIHSTVLPAPVPAGCPELGNRKPGSSLRPQAEGQGSRGRAGGGARGLDCWEAGRVSASRAAAERAFVVT